MTGCPQLAGNAGRQERYLGIEFDDALEISEQTEIRGSRRRLSQPLRRGGRPLMAAINSLTEPALSAKSWHL